MPGSVVRKAIADAACRGVNITIITPQHSDVGLFDILRNKYLGQLIKENIKILYYCPHNLHAKLMLVDSETFVIGSSNFDYRSFRFMHEINLAGHDKKIIETLKAHIEDSKSECIDFNYVLWLKRPWILKVIEWLLVPVRHFF
ncbi:MAG: putative cardiolipin synthase YwiE [Bacteroidetes bacterium ADurb.Bin408]|nr:MAG: putative cardiolipin synthase YwiE [Bacteroidetes bacterium ADurb.Bin408]